MLSKLLSRQCGSRLTIEQYFDDNELLEPLVPVLARLGFQHMDSLQCDNDLEFDELMTAIDADAADNGPHHPASFLDVLRVSIEELIECDTVQKGEIALHAIAHSFFERNEFDSDAVEYDLEDLNHSNLQSYMSDAPFAARLALLLETTHRMRSIICIDISWTNALA